MLVIVFSFALGHIQLSITEGKTLNKIKEWLYWSGMHQDVNDANVT